MDFDAYAAQIQKRISETKPPKESMSER